MAFVAGGEGLVAAGDAPVQHEPAKFSSEHGVLMDSPGRGVSGWTRVMDPAVPAGSTGKSPDGITGHRGGPTSSLVFHRRPCPAPGDHSTHWSSMRAETAYVPCDRMDVGHTEAVGPVHRSPHSSRQTTLRPQTYLAVGIAPVLAAVVLPALITAPATAAAPVMPATSTRTRHGRPAGPRMSSPDWPMRPRRATARAVCRSR
jgi:hypothetical protein